MILLSLILLVLILVYFIYTHFNYWKYQNVDGPIPLPFFGNMLEYFLMKKHYGEIYADIYKKFHLASYVGFYRFGTPSILVRDLDLVKSILVENFNHFRDNDFKLDEKLDPLMSVNSFFAVGDKWKIYRNHLSPLLTAAKVKNIFPLVKNACDQFIDYIEYGPNSNDPDGFEAKEICAKFAIESVASCGFGLEANAFDREDSLFVRKSRQLFDTSTIQKIRLLLSQFIPSLNTIMKMSFLPKEVDDWLRSIIQQVTNRRDNGLEKRVDLLQAVLDTRQRSNIDDNAVVGHALTFLLEGYESSSIVLSYCLYEIANNRDIQKNVKLELEKVFQQNNGQLTAEGVFSLNYMEQVVLETLRMHSPSFAFSRVCTKPFKLPPQYAESKSSATIEPGMFAVIPLFAIHYDANYFPNPDKFDPNRFSETETESSGRNKFSFLGFGEGPRICLGMKFGMMQVMAGVATILSRYTIRISSKTKLPIRFSKKAYLKTSEDGIWLKFDKD